MSAHAPEAKEIFLAAVEQYPPDQWPRFVEEATRGDQALRQYVEALLKAHRETNQLLDGSGLLATVAQTPVGERPGTQIGPYTVLQEIGEGGMGVVYLAEQREPVRRQVALKIIKPGMDSREVIARFAAEEQALAMMDHPNIAKVHDAGATETGRPFFVMELVHGIPLTEYCDQEQLTTRRRLELFVQVCHAVQHAHQKGIIHRDLKPSNVMVTLYDGVPVPKIIDFGVAKAVGGQLTEKTAQTGYGQLIGTPLYMSPEQAALSALDVDTRSDIYSLGVLLYELLTGSTPFHSQRIQGADYDEIRRMIREDEPPQPSSRISTLGAAATTTSAHRQTDPAKLSRLLRRELDWIVMKALEKDRTRRYQTANDFARDIKRYLVDEPIEARPPTFAGRAARWARRHRPLVWASAAVLGIALVAALASALLIAGAYEREKTQRVVAENNAARALTGEQLAKQQEELARQQEALAKRQHQIAIEQKAEAERQRDAAEYGRYVAKMRLARSDRTTGHTERLFRLLEGQVPEPGRPDLRGWEWWLLFSECHTERFSFLSQVRPIAWNADEKYLATVERIGGITICVNIWDVTSGKRRTSLQGCPGSIESISWSPDGKYLAAGNDRSTVVIWEIASGKRVRVLYGHAAAINSIDWNPDGVRLASGGADGTVRVWNAHTAKTLTVLVVASGPVWRVDWHPDGKHLLATFAEERGTGGASIWDTTSGRETHGESLGYARAAEFSPDGTRVAYPHGVWDSKTHEIVKSRVPTVYGLMAWGPDGSRLASTTDSGPIVIWDAKTGDVVSSIVTNAEMSAPPAWSPKARFLAASCRDQTVKVWDTGALSPLITLSTPTERFTTVAFSPDGKRLLAAVGNGTLKVMAVESGKETLSAQYGKDRGWVRLCAAWSPDGERFAVRMHRDNIMIADAATGRQLLPLLPCGDEVTSLAWSPDGTMLAAAVVVGERVRLFSASTGKEVATSTDSLAATGRISIHHVAWRPDGTRLAAAGMSLRVWDSASLQRSPETFVRVPATGTLYALNWSPDGKRLAVGDNKNITIYDATAGAPAQVLRVLEGHATFIKTISWHPFMPRLASGSWDGTVRLWDTSSGEELGVLHAGTSRIHTVAWSSDGLRLAWTTTETDPIRIWDASIADRFLKSHGDLRAKASASAARGELWEAIDVLERLRKLYPDEEDLQTRILHLRWTLAGRTSMGGQVDEAVTLFRQLNAQSPDLPDYQLQLPGVLFDAGRETQALEMLEKTVAEFSQRPEYHEELAFLYERRAIQLCLGGELPNAVPILRKLAKEFPERPGHRSQLVRQLAAQLPKEKASEIFQKLVQEFPDAPEYRRALARRLDESGQRDKAIIELSEAIRLDPRNVGDYSARANLYQVTGDLAKALADVAKTTELEPDNADRWLNRAALYVRQGKWDLALADLSQAARLSPSDAVARAHHDLAQILQKNGQMNEAEQAYRQALTIWEKLGTDQPDKPIYRQHAAWTRTHIAWFLVGAQRTGEAEDAYRQAQTAWEKLVQEFPNAHEYRCALAQLQMSQGYGLWLDEAKSDDAVVHFSAAITVLRELVARFPEETVYQADLAVAYKARGKASGSGYRERSMQDLTETINICRKLIASCQDVPAHQFSWHPPHIVARALSWRALLLTEDGTLDEAIADCTEAIRSDPDYSEAYRHRADAYFKKGEVEKAVIDYRETIRINPKDAQAQDELSKLLEKAKVDQEPQSKEKSDPPNP